MKRLAEYCGLCWHEWPIFTEAELFRIRMKRDTGLEICDNCGIERFGYDTWKNPTPDFTTGNGWETLSAAITEKRAWFGLYQWHALKRIIEQRIEYTTPIEITVIFNYGCLFHELKAADKSRIFDDYLKAIRPKGMT